MFLVEGIRSVEELLASPVKVVGALATERLAEHPRGSVLRDALAARGVAVQDVTEPELESASETDTPQGVVAIAETPKRSLAGLELAPSARLVVLDAVQDPGNVGTILRTAAALGAAATLALPGTADLWNSKVVRGGMGAQFRHPCLHCTWDELDAFRDRHRIALWGADAGGDPVESIRAPERLALVVGNEGNGLTAASRQRVERLVGLPLAAGAESLNVAVAAGILLYLLRR